MNSITSKSKPISHFLFSIKPSNIFSISYFSSSPSPSSSSSSSSSSSYSSSRRHDEDSKNVRVTVWWDIENCGVPIGINVFKISNFITSAVRVNGIKGQVQVTAFGDILSLSRPIQEALSSTGVNLVHVPQGQKNNGDRSLLVDLMYWISQNPPPAHVFLISGDRDFAGILHKLRMNNYNILLAGGEGEHTPGVLCSAASIMWHWNELARGENLCGKHFNQPPDGPYNSWYGHYRGPLEDPYEISEQNSSVEADNLCNDELSSESKCHPVPLTILRQLCRIVNEYPEGLTFNEFRCEITKNKVPIDKDFYGYKKFPCLLQSIPHIVKLESNPDGQYYIRPVPQNVRASVDSNDTSLGLMTEKQQQDVEVSRKANGKIPTITRMVDVESQSPVSPYVNPEERTAEDKPKKVTPVTFENKTPDEPQRDNQISVPPEEEQNSKSKVGFLKRLWYGEGVDAMKTNINIPGHLNSSCGSTKMFTPEERTESTNQHVARHPTQSSSTVLNEDVKSNKLDEPEAHLGLFTRVIMWFSSWRNSSVKTLNEKSSEETGFTVGNKKNFDDCLHAKKHELFSKDTFWSALQSFLRTQRGSDIVSSSTSRDQIAVRLQKEGPLVLRPLQENDLHYLVDLLISKKWIAEFPAKTPRFRTAYTPVVSSPELQPQNIQPHSTNGLSSIFKGSSPQENPQSRISSAVLRKPSEKSRSEVLVDCQRLLDDLLSQNASGFNMGLFKKCFLEKYGYPLDHQKLGYPKLVSLVQIMPGVKVEAAHVYSDKVFYSPGIESLGVNNKSSDSDSDAPQKNEGETPWEELGPMAKKERDSSTLGQGNGTYEPSLSDDEFSEMEDAKSSPGPVKAEDQIKSSANKEDSSLLQILDSWYGTNDSRLQGSPAKGSKDTSNEESDSTPSSNTSVKGDYACARKQRSQRSYTFVANPIEDKKSNLTDGIVCSLKKSGESKMQL